MFGRYNLLCNSCNWEFVGLAVPGTVTEHVRKRPKHLVNNEQLQTRQPASRANQVAETQKLSETINLNGSIDGEKKIAVENLTDSGNQISTVAKPLPNINESEGSVDVPTVEASNLIDLALNEIESSEGDNNVSSNVSSKVESGNLIPKKALSSSAKSKKRVRIKKKK